MMICAERLLTFGAGAAAAQVFPRMLVAIAAPHMRLDLVNRARPQAQAPTDSAR